MIGQTVAQYKILEKIGEGGMGIVYRAHDTTLDRLVALKFLPAHLNSSEQDKARLIQEARAAAALNHPNVCSIIEIRDHDGQTFIVMEYVDGQTLTAKKGTISTAQALGIGAQIAEGLAAAHEKGIVHRDIKPDNIMIRRDGIVQIMDFGVAKLRGVSRLTRERSTIGTAGYMSPEQIQGADVDHRSDIFSLGVVLYELFTGELPFKGVHETALSYEIVNVDPPPMSRVKQGIDPLLDAVVAECLEKDPTERTQSARQVAVDLMKLKRESGRHRVAVMPGGTHAAAEGAAEGGRRSPGPVPRRTVILGAGAVLVLLCAALLVWRLVAGSSAGAKDVVRFTYTFPPGLTIAPVIDVSPDGKQFAFVGYDRIKENVFVRPMAGLDAIRLSGSEADLPPEGTEGAEAPFFSKDGQWMGFVTVGELRKVSLRGGSSAPIAPISFFRGASWGDDNSIVYAPSPTSGLWRVSGAGGAPEQVTFLDSSAGEISHRYPDMLPGSRAVLFTVKTGSITRFSDAKIAVQRIGDRDRKILVEGGTFAHYIPTGHILFGRGSNVYAVPFDPDRLELKGSPVQVLEGGMLGEAWGTMMLAVSPTGTLIYSPRGAVGGDSNCVYSYDLHGHATALIGSPDSYGAATVSPDGRRIATYMNAANDDIWVYDIARRLRTRFTFGGGNNWFPLWTPDGKRIIYTAERRGPANLFWRPVDGSGGEERLATGADAQYPTSCSADGRYLAYHQQASGGNFDIWVLPLAGDRTPRLFLHSQFDESFASFSPDGRWMCYQSNESGQFEIYAVPFPKGDGKWQISTGGGICPAWGKGGREIIYYRSATRSMMRVPVAYDPDVRPGKSEELFRLPAEPVSVSTASRDGEHIVVILPGPEQKPGTLVVVLNWFEELKKKLSAQ